MIRYFWSLWETHTLCWHLLGSFVGLGAIIAVVLQVVAELATGAMLALGPAQSLGLGAAVGYVLGMQVIAWDLRS